MMINLVHCKKALEIVQERLEATKQPPKLEMLVAWRIEEEMPRTLYGRTTPITYPCY